MAVLTPLRDGHCHTITTAALSADDFASWCTERGTATAAVLAGPLGRTIRRWCPPVLGLPDGAPWADYLSVRGYFPTRVFTASRFVLFSSRASTGGGPYVVEDSYALSA